RHTWPRATRASRASTSRTGASRSRGSTPSCTSLGSLPLEGLTRLVELAVPAPERADVAVAVAEDRALAEDLVLPDGDVLEVAAAEVVDVLRDELRRAIDVAVVLERDREAEVQAAL